MRKIRACGFLIVRGQPIDSFLLMKHAKRWDLPKGHVDGDESDLQCAYRELEEETGLSAEQVERIPGFEFRTTYELFSERFGQRCEKTVVIFLARCKPGTEENLKLTEHLGCEWRKWDPPHQIQVQTIDPLLRELHQFLSQNPNA